MAFVNYEGKGFIFDDSMSDDQIYETLNSFRTDDGGWNMESIQANPSVKLTQQGSPSFLEGVGSSLKSMGANILAAHAQDPELSNYANSRAKRANEEYSEALSRMGAIQQFGTQALGYGSALGAGLITRSPVVGAVAIGGLTTAETLREQAMLDQDYDVAAANLAGLTTGGINLATGGLANVAKAKMLANTTAAAKAAGTVLPTTAPVAARIGVNAADDLVSGLVSHASINLATGKPFDSGMVEAGAASVLGGLGIRGALKGAGQLNKLMGSPINTGGEKALDDIGRFKSETGLSPSESFVDDAFGYANQQHTRLDELMNARGADVDDKAVELVTLGATEGGRYADLEAMRTATDVFGLEPTKGTFNFEASKGLDRTVDTYNFGKDKGLSEQDMIRSSETVNELQTVSFGREKAKLAGETPEADFNRVKTSYNKFSNSFQGSMTENKTLAERLVLAAEKSGGDVRSAMEFKSAINDYNHALNDYVMRGHNNAEAIKFASERMMKSGSRLGALGELKDITGRAGQFDPVMNAMIGNRVNNMFEKRYPNIRQGVADIGDTGSPASYGNVSAVDAAALGAGKMTPFLRKAFNLASLDMGARSSRKAFARAKAEGKIFTESASAGLVPRKSFQDALSSGDSGLAASRAADGLAGDGIDTAGLTARSTPEPVVAEPVVAEPVAPVVEAPTAPVVQPVEKTAPVPARAPKAPEGPVQAAPEPAPAPTPEKMARKPRTVKKAEELEEAKAAKDKVEELDGGVSEPITDKIEVQDVTPKKKEALTPDKIQRVEKKKEAPKRVAKTEELSRKPTVPEKAQEPVEEPTEAPKPIDEDTPKPVVEKKPVDAKDGMAPKIKKAEEKVEVEEKAPEAPKREPGALTPKAKKVEEPAAEEKPDPKLMARGLNEKQEAKAEEPKAEEPKAEEVKAEPVKEEVPEKPRVSSTELITEPLKKQAEKLANLSPKEIALLPPGKRLEMEKASADLHLIRGVTNSVSDTTKTSTDEVFGFIKELGGIDGLKAKASSEGYETTKGGLQSYLTSRIREFRNLKEGEARAKLESVKEKVSEKITPIKGEKAAEVSRVADKHGMVRSRLEASGFDKDIIDEALKRGGATDTTQDFDPVTVNKWASTLNARKKEDAKIASKDAQDKAKVAADNAKLKDQKWLAQQYLKGLKVEGDTELTSLVDNLLGKGRGKPVSDQQMQALFNKIDNYLNNQKTAYENAFKQGGASSPLDKAKAATYSSMQKTLQENRARADAEIVAAEKEAADAAVEAQKKTAEYEKLFDQAEKNMKKFDDLKALDVQIREMTDSLMELGAPEHFVQKAIHNAFIKLDAPLKGPALNKVRARAINELEKIMNAEVPAVKIAAKAEIQKLTDDQLKDVGGQSVFSSSGQASSPESKGVTEALTEELSSRGFKNEAALVKLVGDIEATAEQRKLLYPNKPELWITGDDASAIQDLMGKSFGSNYSGKVLKRLRRKFYGDSNLNYMNLSNKRAGDLMKGEKVTGVGDIVVKNDTPAKVSEAPSSEPAPAPVTEAHKRVEAIAEQVKAEVPVVHQVAPEGAPSVAPTVSLVGDKVSIVTPKAEPKPKVNPRAIKKPKVVVEKEPDTSKLSDAENAMIEAMAARFSAPKAEVVAPKEETPLKKLGIGKALGEKDLGDLTTRDYEKIESIVRNPDNGLDAAKAEKMLNEGKVSTVGDLFEELMKTQKKPTPKQEVEAKPSTEKKGVLDQDIKPVIKKTAESKPEAKKPKKKEEPTKEVPTLKGILNKTVDSLTKEEKAVLQQALVGKNPDEAKQMMSMSGMPVGTLLAIIS